MRDGKVNARPGRLVIRLGLRLAVAGGREAAVRLAVIAAAVAIGVGLLLTTLAGMNAIERPERPVRLALHRSEHRAGGCRRGVASRCGGGPETTSTAGPSAGVDVAATGPGRPVPPGIAQLPGPGEYYASPALRAAAPPPRPTELGDRYPGHQVGTIGPAALPSPTRCSSSSAAPRPSWARPGRPEGHQHRDPPAEPLQERLRHRHQRRTASTLILAVVAGGLLFPVLIFIGTATRLGAARREQRFAAMRLVGATPRQISVISAVESTLAAAVGTAAGFGLFFALRPALASDPVHRRAVLPRRPVAQTCRRPGGGARRAGRRGGGRLVALRRVQISPLGVTRRVTPKPPRA